MKIEQLSAITIPGFVAFKAVRHLDERGSFIKPFDKRLLESKGISMPVAEAYFSESHQGVLRGFHFQTPPHEHQKIVTCLSGRILDVFLDLRTGSPAFGKPQSFELRGEDPTVLVIPAGVAHAFYSYEDHSLMAYWVDSCHAPQHDMGLKWDSVGFEWPVTKPILSPRDAALPPFSEFRSPFVFRT